MAKYLYNNPRRHWVFDFRKKRVVETMTEGPYTRREIITKYDIGYLIHANGDSHTGVLIMMFDAYKYDEAKQELLRLLEAKQELLRLLEAKHFDNLTILK